jgi:hypothetical protein
VALPDGGAVFIGKIVVNTLVIDGKGNVYKADPTNKDQFPSLMKPNYAKMAKLF